MDNNKEEMINEVEPIECEIKQINKAVAETIQPIIFLDQDNGYSPEDSPYPSIDATMLNMVTLLNTKLSINNSDIDNVNRMGVYYDITTMESNQVYDIIVHRIVEEVMMSFSSVLDGINVPFMRYFYIREAVYNNLVNLFITDNKYREYSAISVYINNILFTKDNSYINNYKDALVNTIVSSVYNAIMFGITTAVDDVCLRIHLIPNLMELKRDIVETFSIDKDTANAKYFWTLADANIKSFITQQIFSQEFYVYMKDAIYNIISILDYYNGLQANKLEIEMEEKRKIQAEKRKNYRPCPEDF